MQTKTTYITDDGRKFDNEEEARQHEAIEPVVAAYITASHATGMVATRKANDIREFLVWQAKQ